MSSASSSDQQGWTLVKTLKKHHAAGCFIDISQAEYVTLFAGHLTPEQITACLVPL
jgi:hypothetical protein